MSKDASQHILGLAIQNFKKIGIFNVDLTDKSLVILSGKNRQGKSSVLDAIHSALAGKQYWKKQIDEPIKKGEDEAHVVISTDKFEIHRYWKRNGKDYIKIKDKDGIPQGAEETLLSRFYNEYSRDPHRMSQMDAKDQTEFLFDLLGMTDQLEEYEETREQYYNMRREINRDLKKTEGALESMDEYDEIPEIPNRSELMDELTEAQDQNYHLKQVRRSIESDEEKIEALKDKIERLKNRIGDLEESVEADKKYLEENEFIDTDEIRKRIDQAEEIAQEARKAEEFFEKKEEVEELAKKSDEFTSSIEAVDSDKEQFVAGLEMPVDGMGLDEENRITYNGTPVKDLSTSESIIFWSKVFMSTKPELKFLTLDDGESLDSDSRKEIEDFAKQEDLLYIMTVVDETGETGIVLEEGEIKSNNYEK